MIGWLPISDENGLAWQHGLAVTDAGHARMWDGDDSVRLTESWLQAHATRRRSGCEKSAEGGSHQRIGDLQAAQWENCDVHR